jgi:hypothetical protein
MNTKQQKWLTAGAALLILAGLAALLAKPQRLAANDVAGRRSAAVGIPPAQEGSSAAITSGPLRVSGANGRYFADGAGRIVYLTGSHTWSNFQDNGNPFVFDYNQYLDFLVANNHNFTRLWRWEQSRWTVETPDDGYWFSPEGPWLRSGPGNALDGKLKWDLNQFDQSYFDRLRARVVAAGERNIYVAVMLFDGWSVSANKGGFAQNNPWRGHPFNVANNINGVNADSNNNNSGEESHELGNAAVLAYQQAYVAKVIDTLNDLDNVLWEISNESHGEATAWQNAMVDYIKQYEAARPKQHPVGMTAEWPNGNDAELFASNADWISPSSSVYMSDPPDAGGAAVIILDTDHLWGIGGDRKWVWKSFTRGLNPIFMDGYNGAGYGVGGAGFNFNDPTWVKLRANMGYTLAYANRMNLLAATPRGDLCSTGYASPTPLPAAPSSWSTSPTAALSRSISPASPAVSTSSGATRTTAARPPPLPSAAAQPAPSPRPSAVTPSSSSNSPPPPPPPPRPPCRPICQRLRRRPRRRPPPCQRRHPPPPPCRPARLRPQQQRSALRRPPWQRRPRWRRRRRQAQQRRRRHYRPRPTQLQPPHRARSFPAAPCAITSTGPTAAWGPIGCINQRALASPIAACGRRRLA